MPQTHEWSLTTTNGLNVPFMGQDQYRQQIGQSPTVEGATLLRTIFEAHVNVFVPGTSSPPPADWWPTGYMEVRAIWSPDGSIPTPAFDTHDPGDVGSLILKPTPFGDSSLAHPYVVQFSSEQLIDTEARRKAAPGVIPAVWFFTYYFDRVRGLSGDFDTECCIRIRARTLWGY